MKRKLYQFLDFWLVAILCVFWLAMAFVNGCS